ncbi:PDR/VanB family oxidoreductase [Ramlibacter sp. MAHUQ-53]|uniref:PDR/VanB family oxidoreductase n=1 Tax=unclassified Ramlibacter TaxID=2617605 RepID=UPI00363F083B
MTQLQVKVLRRREEAEGIASFELARADGGPLPAFSAGSHIDVHLPGGLVRQYSLANDPHDATHYRIGVLRDPASRGGSVAMHDQVREGDVLTISEPRNHFPLVAAPHIILLAGGIGVTPLLCMAQRLAATGVSFELHACNRSLARSAFVGEMQAFGERFHLHLDDGDAAQKLDLPALLKKAPAGSRIYVCGPGGFIDFVVNTAKAQGWPADHVHLEYFGAAPQDTTGDQAFEVRIASTGKTYTVPADQPVSTALAAQGVEIMVSCEQGVCGTCLTRVLEGEVDHRDLYLTDAEKACHDQFLPCCSRAKGKLLVLDL